MKPQKRPFLYTLVRCGADDQDFLFKRIRETDPGNYEANTWGMHMDIDDPTPERVLVFVHATTPGTEIVHAINRVQTYFREQTEPLFPEPETTQLG